MSAGVEDYSTAIRSKQYRNDLPHMALQVPPELIQVFAESSGGDGGGVRVISALYYNVEGVCSQVGDLEPIGMQPSPS